MAPGAEKLAAWPADVQSLARLSSQPGCRCTAALPSPFWPHPLRCLHRSARRGYLAPPAAHVPANFLALSAHVLASGTAGRCGHKGVGVVCRPQLPPRTGNGNLPQQSLPGSHEGVMEVLRLRSAASTGPYIRVRVMDAARLASLAMTMSAATVSRPAAAGPDGRHAVGGAAQGRALLLGAESLHDSAEPGPAARRRTSPPDSDSPTRGPTSIPSCSLLSAPSAEREPAGPDGRVAAHLEDQHGAKPPRLRLSFELRVGPRANGAHSTLS
jgi:hypothetical protein